jgi:glycosyltransferase involved in cell wall biosynthesis
MDRIWDEPSFAAFEADEGITRSENRNPLVSAIIPCLNEERTLGICIRKALDAFARRGIVGEVVVGDNGSTDRSVEIARALGAWVVHQPVKGYGAAISAALAEAG